MRRIEYAVAMGLALSLWACQNEPATTAGHHEGEPFAGAQSVSVADLVAAPESFTGKRVLVSGKVVAMCHHKRDWFALAAGEKEGGHIRVLTTPSFRVPEGSIGKKARAEGAVEVVEISEEIARHFAEKHQIGDADAKGPVKRIVVRASAAEFM